MSEEKLMDHKTAQILGKMLEKQNHYLCVDHAEIIGERLYSDWHENEKKTTQLTIEPKFVLVMSPEGEIQVSAHMKMVKKIPTPFDVDPITYNPNQPDMFEGDDPIISNNGNDLPPEAEPGEASKKSELEPEKDLDADKDKKEPVDTAPGPKESAAPESETEEEKTSEIPADEDRCPNTHPKLKLRCVLLKGHDGNCNLNICGQKHADKKRVCIKEKGHDGNHKYQEF